MTMRERNRQAPLPRYRCEFIALLFSVVTRVAVKRQIDIERKKNMKELVIGCDNAAVDLKNIVRDYLREQKYIVEDVGVNDVHDNSLYPLVAEQVCERVVVSNYKKRGILLCGTGLGMSISANKIKGIRATVCHDIYSAERSILSNNANVLCMGARVIGPELAKRIIKEWIKLEFKDSPSTPKVELIKSLEAKNFK